MLTRIPSDLAELVAVERHVQSTLADTLDYSLKRPAKLRELTCRLLGFPNGFQQLQAHWDARVAHDQTSERFANRLVDEVASLTGNLEASEQVAFALDELVYDVCGTSKRESAINNSGPCGQVTAIVEAGVSLDEIVRHLEAFCCAGLAERMVR